MKELKIVSFNEEVDSSSLRKVADILALRLKRTYSRVLVAGHLKFKPGPIALDTKYLEHLIAQGSSPMLGFTKLPLHFYSSRLEMADYNSSFLINGLSSPEAGKAVVSCASFVDSPQDVLIRRLALIGLHEVGHLQGLEHHIAHTQMGGYCSMTPGFAINLMHNLPRDRDGQFDYRNLSFCKMCESALANQP